MDSRTHRRRFLEEVSGGMLIAGLGFGTAVELALASPRSEDGPDALRFGALEPLVALMQQTPADRLLPAVVQKFRAGADLRTLTAAAALANARSFGGEDYIGFHTVMAIAPAYHMAAEMPESKRLLPLLKVFHRNARRIQEAGQGKTETLRVVQAAASQATGNSRAEALRTAVRAKDVSTAEAVFAAIAKGAPEDAFNELLFTVQDNTEVHRVVLPYRAWDLLEVIGKEHAHTLLRQSVRYCVRSEKNWRHDEKSDEPRQVLPALLDRHHLLSRPLGTRPADDAWVDRMSRTIFESSPRDAAEAAAAALADGVLPDAVGEAVSLAANQLLLRDPGRKQADAPNKPAGSVHGDSIGVHACDSANAWRHMTRACNPRNVAASLILGAYQVALDRIQRGGDFLHWRPWPLDDSLAQVKDVAADALLRQTEAAIRANDQARACALVCRYGAADYSERPVFDLLLRYAVSEDGALHAEKFYRTVAEEFAATRPAFRWRHMVALARVTASEFGQPAPGYANACELLSVRT